MPANQLTQTIGPVLLLEREAEMAALEAMLDAAQSGDGRLVIVEGSAGIGKSRLLAEARSLAASAGFEVLTSRGGELEGQFAFGIVRQLFEAPLAAATPQIRAELLAGAAELSATLFASAPTGAAGETNESSFAMLHGLYWLTANFASRTPTLLVVDDLHWADEPSVRWLVYLARRLEGLPLLVVAAARPPEEAFDPALLIELLGTPSTVVIKPGALGRASVEHLVRVRLGAEPSTEFTAALESASSGNPLYLGALLDAAAADGLAPSTEHVPRVLEMGSHALSRNVLLRISRAGTDASSLIQAAAVLGGGMPLRFAAELACMDLVGAGDAATTLVRAGLLQREDPIEFTHPVIRSAVYEQIGAGDRFRLHRVAAQVLLAAGARPEQAAAHLTLTAPNGDGFVSATLRAAAARASAQGSQVTAVSYLRRALEEPPPEGEVGAVLADLGLAERLVDSAASAQHLGQALELLTDPEMRSQIALTYSESLWFAASPAEAVHVLEQLIDEVDASSDLREQALAGLIGTARWDPDLHPVAVERLAGVDVDALGGGLGADSLMAVMAEQEVHAGLDRARARRLAERALASGRLAETRDLGLACAVAALRATGDAVSALAALDAGIRAGRRVGDILSVASLQHLRGVIVFGCGDLTAAESEMADARELVDSVAPGREWPSKAGGPWRLHLACEQGDIGAAAEILRQIEEQPGDVRYAAWICDARGRLRVIDRRFEDALADFLACGQALDLFGISNPAYLPWRSRAALALQQLDRGAEAREFAEDELALSEQWGAPQTVGISLHALALVRGGRAGLLLLDQAVEVLANSMARLELARALVDFGAALRRANRRSDARLQLRQAVDLAQRCGAQPLIERANDELAATGAHRRTALLGGVESLTASERRVAQMAAEELSNKEIAQALFVTVKTVEQHLGRVYRKLDISSRRQLGAVLGLRPEPATGNG
jgi:DNA-binding CsgD family transcriptional regulator